MKITLIDEAGKALETPYILRLPGWTEERYYRDAPRQGKCEYVHGDLIIMTPMSADHSRITSFLDTLLTMFCKTKKLGEILPGTTIRLEPEVNREPDLFFVPQEKIDFTSKVPLEIIPPLVIEVSWTTRNIDLGEKAQDYERAGVEEYWVVDIERDELICHLLEDGTYQTTTLTEGRLESQVLEGFYLQVEWLWKRPLPLPLDILRTMIDL